MKHNHDTRNLLIKDQLFVTRLNAHLHIAMAWLTPAGRIAFQPPCILGTLRRLVFNTTLLHACGGR